MRYFAVLSKTMKAIISTTINEPAEKMWKELQHVASLMKVASPLLVFKTRDAGELPEKWETGREYPLFLYFLGVVPLGRHFIKIVKIDEMNRVILSHEHGTLAGTWDHMLKLNFRD